MGESENRMPSGPYFVIELTHACNNDCIYCYNAWKNNSEYPRGGLSLEEWKRVIKKIRDETESRLLSFTGGEPTLFGDLVELISYASGLGFKVNLITNGTLLSDRKAKGLIDAGVSLFELPILSDREEIHNSMAGAKSWQKVINSVYHIKNNGGFVVAVMVVTRKNLDRIRETIELAILLGINDIMFNRFNPGGRGAEKIEELLPNMEELTAALETADKTAEDYGIRITCNIPIHPCLIDMNRFRFLSTGFCGAGTPYAYPGIDPMGNLRPCNHTDIILGNVLESNIMELLNNSVMKEFIAAVPPICKPCPMAPRCQGGCKASAQVCYGSIYEEDPFFKLNMHKNPMIWEQKQKMTGKDSGESED